MKFYLIGKIVSISSASVSISTPSTQAIGSEFVDTQTIYTLPDSSEFPITLCPGGYAVLGEHEAKIGDILAVEARVNMRSVRVERVISVTDGGEQ